VKFCAVVKELFIYSFHQEQEMCLRQTYAAQFQNTTELRRNNGPSSEMRVLSSLIAVCRHNNYYTRWFKYDRD